MWKPGTTWKVFDILLQGIAKAHTGFLQRARSVNLGPLQKRAEALGLRLVLCGALISLRATAKLRSTMNTSVS